MAQFSIKSVTISKILGKIETLHNMWTSPGAGCLQTCDLLHYSSNRNYTYRCL